MKTKAILAVLILSAALFFSACSKNTEDTEATSTPDAAETAMPTEAPAQDEAIIPVTVSDLESNLTIGTNIGVAMFLLGTDYKVVQSSEGTIWRYDVGAEEGYTYADDTVEPDRDGLNSGKVKMQVFLYYGASDDLTKYEAYQPGAAGSTEVSVDRMTETGEFVHETK